MTKISTLYHFIKELHAENNILLREYKITEIEKDSRDYIILYLSTGLEQQAHFSIDKFYDATKGIKHGLTPLHYTLTEGSQIGHGYLDGQGAFLYPKIKKATSKKSIKLSKEEKNRLKEKIKTSFLQYKPFLDRLLAEKNNRGNKAKEKADTLENKLSHLSCALDQENVRKAYLDYASQFVQAVKDFNQYSEHKDLRDKSVLRTFKNIKIIQACFESESKTKIDSPKKNINYDNNDSDHEDSTLLPQTNSIETLYKLVTMTFFTVSETFKKAIFDSQSLASKIHLAAQLEEQLLLIYSFPSNMICEKDNSKIKTTVAELNIYYSQCASLLKQMALEINLEAFSQHFPSLKKYLKEDFYIKLTNPLQEKLIPIYDFLNKNDPNYNAFILKLTQNTHYAASITIAKNILEEIAFYASRVTLSISLLYKLYIQNKFSLFEMLLRHGVCPNEWGITLKTKKIYDLSLTLFYSIVHGEKEDTHLYRYLRLLIQYQADPNETYTKASQLYYSKQIIQDYHNFKKFSIIDNRHFNISIVTLAMKKGTEGLEIILNTASLSNLACALGHHLLNEDKIKTVHALNEQYGIYFFNDPICVPKIPTAPILYVAYNCYTSEDMAHKMGLIQSKIKEKIVSLSDQEFQKEYDSLLNFAQTKFTTHNIADAFPAFLGSEFLLMTRCFSLHTNSVSQIQFLKNNGIQCLYDSILELIVEIEHYKFSFFYIFSLKTINKHAYPHIAIAGESKKTRIDEPATTKVSEQKNSDNSEDTISPICSAAKEGNLEKLKNLLEKFPENIDKTPPNAKGWTPLHYACATDHLQCAKLLILSGANIFIKNDNQKIPFHPNILKDQVAKKELEALFFNKLTSTKVIERK